MFLFSDHRSLCAFLPPGGPYSALQVRTARAGRDAARLGKKDSIVSTERSKRASRQIVVVFAVRAAALQIPARARGAARHTKHTHNTQSTHTHTHTHIKTRSHRMEARPNEGTSATTSAGQRGRGPPWSCWAMDYGLGGCAYQQLARGGAYSRSIRCSILRLICFGSAWKCESSCSVVSETSFSCANRRRIFMMRTIAASIWNERSTSTTCEHTRNHGRRAGRHISMCSRSAVTGGAELKELDGAAAADTAAADATAGRSPSALRASRI